MAMTVPGPHTHSGKRPLPALDNASLEQLALAYAARFATTAAKLTAYLRRKLRERGWDGEDEPQVDAIVARFAGAGYVDDDGYARMRSGALLRRGYGARRVEQALHAAGVDEAIRAGNAPGERQQREAALIMARRRRFGPFAAAPYDPARREKQLAAMIRAGHDFAMARSVIDAQDAASVEQWVEEAGDGEE